MNTEPNNQITKTSPAVVIIWIVAILFIIGFFYYVSQPSSNSNLSQTSSDINPTSTLATTAPTNSGQSDQIDNSQNVSSQNVKPTDSYSDVNAFEVSFNNYNTAGAKLFAYVIAFNISGVSPDIEEFQNDFEQVVKSTDPGTRLYLAQQGLPLVQEYINKLESTSDLASTENTTLLDLNTKAGAIHNANLRNQALSVANDANQLSQFTRAYQSALEDKWNVMAIVFQDVINESGGLNSAYVELQSTSQQVTTDNNTIAQLQSGSYPGSQSQTDFAQFKGLAESQ